MNNQIHQTLHGYADGHKLLASSIDLDNNIKNILLSESDSPGQEFHYAEKECFTGYSLVEHGYYIFSKTWVAKEINRPGCVWTHSFLIPIHILSDKNILDKFNPFEYFLSSSDEFKLDLVLHPINYNESNHKFNSGEEINLEFPIIFSNIFSNDKQVILSSAVITVSNIIYFWSKLWPKLRVSFSFKTWSPKASSNRPYFDKYDLLINDYMFDEINNDNWAKPIFDNNIDAFLWEHGKTLNGKKSNIHTLCLCWNFMHDRNFDKLSMLILKWKKAPISLIKNISKSLELQDITLPVAYLISTYILTLEKKDISSEVIKKVGEILYSIDVKMLFRVVNLHTEHTKDIIISNINSIDIKLVIDLYERGLLLNDDVITENIISNKDFWSNCKNKKEIFKKVIKNNKLKNFIPILDFSPLDKDIIYGYTDELLELTLSKFDDLNDEWKMFLLDNQKVINYKSLLNSGNVNLCYFMLCEFRIETLKNIPDNVITYLYENSKKDKNINYKIALLITDDITTKYSTLICKAFDDICYLLASYDLSYKEEKRLEYNIEKIAKFNIKVFSTRRQFMIFSIKYSHEHKLPLKYLTSYNSNLKELNELNELKTTTKKRFNMFFGL